MEYLSLKYIKTNYIKLYLIILRNKIILKSNNIIYIIPYNLHDIL